MAAGAIARSPHFVLHCALFDAPGRTALPEAEWPAPLRPLAAGPHTWLAGFTPKRWARRAVTRNAVRRQIDNVGRALQAQLPRAAYLVRLRAAIDRADYPSASSVRLRMDLRLELEQLFAQGLARLAATAGAAR